MCDRTIDQACINEEFNSLCNANYLTPTICSNGNIKLSRKEEFCLYIIININDKSLMYESLLLDYNTINRMFAMIIKDIKDKMKELKDTFSFIDIKYNENIEYGITHCYEITHNNTKMYVYNKRGIYKFNNNEYDDFNQLKKSILQWFVNFYTKCDFVSLCGPFFVLNYLKYNLYLNVINENYVILGNKLITMKDVDKEFETRINLRDSKLKRLRSLTNKEITTYNTYEDDFFVMGDIVFRYNNGIVKYKNHEIEEYEFISSLN